MIFNRPQLFIMKTPQNRISVDSPNICLTESLYRYITIIPNPYRDITTYKPSNAKMYIDLLKRCNIFLTVNCTSDLFIGMYHSNRVSQIIAALEVSLNTSSPRESYSAPYYAEYPIHDDFESTKKIKFIGY